MKKLTEFTNESLKPRMKVAKPDYYHEELTNNNMRSLFNYITESIPMNQDFIDSFKDALISILDNTIQEYSKNPEVTQQGLGVLNAHFLKFFASEQITREFENKDVEPFVKKLGELYMKHSCAENVKNNKNIDEKLNKKGIDKPWSVKLYTPIIAPAARGNILGVDEAKYKNMVVDMFGLVGVQKRDVIEMYDGHKVHCALWCVFRRGFENYTDKVKRQNVEFKYGTLSIKIGWIDGNYTDISFAVDISYKPKK